MAQELFQTFLVTPRKPSNALKFTHIILEAWWCYLAWNNGWFLANQVGWIGNLLTTQQPGRVENPFNHPWNMDQITNVLNSEFLKAPTSTITAFLLYSTTITSCHAILLSGRSHIQVESNNNDLTTIRQWAGKETIPEQWICWNEKVSNMKYSVWAETYRPKEE